jgi:hypothetical protein
MIHSRTKCWDVCLLFVLSISCETPANIITRHSYKLDDTLFRGFHHHRIFDYSIKNVLSLSGGYEKYSSNDSDESEKEIPLNEVYGDDDSDSVHESSTPESTDTVEENSRLSGPITDPSLPLRITPYNQIPFLELWPGLGPQVKPGQVYSHRSNA